MNANAADVISGHARWSAKRSDAIAFLSSLPDDSVDLLFTSPPYLIARTYGADLGKPLDEWVAWMVDVVKAAAPKVKGLIAINCEGQTRNFQYLPAPYLFMADLHRAGFNLRRPAFFHRVGIPGSGGPDWLRADVEPIICITREGKLPWSDNTACGHPPKWGPGGEMSHMLTDGTRINQWGKTGSQTGTTATGNKEKPGIGKPRPSHQKLTKNAHGVRTDKPIGTRVTGNKSEAETYRAKTKAEKLELGAKRHTKRDAAPQANGEDMREQAYLPPVLANPGNLISLNVGGGQMGHPCSHTNEAPFPLDLAAFFIKSFCPPNGITCDPFGGSGTVLDAAVQNGRRAISCDIRQSQVDLMRKRMSTVTPSMFVEEM